MGTFVEAVPLNDANAVVLDGVDAAGQRASTALRSANNNLSKLSNFAFYTGEPVNIALEEVPTDGVQANFPSAPIAPSLSLNLPDFPSDILFDVIPQLETGEIPTLDSEAPNLLYPATPTPFSEVAPTAPDIDTDIPYPDAPIQVIPSVPTLEDIDLPTVPIITTPVFTESLPTQALNIPGITFFWSESPYTSSTMTAVQSALLSRINGGTGLDPTVEQQIWDRSRTRETAGQLKSRNELLSNNAQTGFSRPTGSTLASMDFLAQETQNQVNGLSRDIAIKQAELEQSNIQSTIQSIISLEQLLMKNFNDVQSRAFEAERFTQELAFNIYNAEVSKFNAELESYKAFTQAFDILLRAELQKIQIYNAELEGLKLIGQLNQQSIQIYTAQLDGLQTEVDLYKTQLEAINTRLQGENLRISVYKTELDGYTALIQAKNSEYQGFKTTVEAESTKMDAFTSEVQAFTSRVDAYSKGILADRTKSDVAVQTEQLRLQQQSLKLDTYSKNVQAEVSAFQAQTLAYQGTTNAYSAEVRTEASRIDTENKLIDQRITNAKATVDVALQNAQINLGNINASSAQGLEAAKAVAQISGSLAASSMAGVTFGGTVSHDVNLNNNLGETHPFEAL